MIFNTGVAQKYQGYSGKHSHAGLECHLKSGFCGLKLGSSRPFLNNNMVRCISLPRSAFQRQLAVELSTALLIFAGAFAGNSQSTRLLEQTNGVAPPDWIQWQHERHESIAGTNGWMTLISLYWLPEGVTSAGSDPTNQLTLPAGRVPGFVGTFSRQKGSVRFVAAPGVVATSDETAIHETEMRSDAATHPSTLKIGALTCAIIERGGRFGVRVRDPDSPARLHFAGLRYFPYDQSWRIEGRFAAFPFRHTLRVPDASGGMQELISPGALVFSHGGKQFRLDVVDEGANEVYFVIFTDRTAGDSTYEAGRFLYVVRPDVLGRVTINFNRSFTPPCGFTPFATCPRPPQQNWLPIAVTAGERKPVETR